MARTINTDVIIDGQQVRISRKNVSGITLRIKSPDGPLLISAPYYAPDFMIAALIREKRSWIAQQRAELAQRPMARASDASKKETAEWLKVVKEATPPLIAKWERIIGVKAGKLAYRNMTSRWGSCQPKTGRICINTRLALYPPECLEYIVVHELCHLIVSGHGPRFNALLDTYLPDWKKRKAKLK
ncbi:MAG: SprT family zinc-dependent metalloprotease [Eggerthellaceae bacterium]|nr:SprT family zinc-dependent metalloprotease [Eggerthellaceae bacterium]